MQASDTFVIPVRLRNSVNVAGFPRGRDDSRKRHALAFAAIP
jgi:hypothetical protein